MLRRPVPGHRPGDQQPTSATGGGFGIVSKPFKTPTPLAPKRNLDLPARKRKAVSYKDAGGDQSGSDAENEEPDGKKAKTSGYAMGNKEYDGNGVLGGMGKFYAKKFPVFKPKEKVQVFGRR